MYEQLINKNKKLALIGLGYVGLPIALEFAKKISVIGFDVNEKRVEMMRNNIDPSQELEAAAFEGCDIEFTAGLEVLKQANFFIVAVPTPVDESNVPDLMPIKRASETIGKVIKKGDYVVFESTVYPGCTEEDCVPIIEKLSGLKNIIERLHAGGGIVLFPEGTRTPDGSLQPARSGIGLVVLKSDAPVVPVRLFGTFEAYGRDLKFPRPYRIAVKYDGLTTLKNPPPRLATSTMGLPATCIGIP